MHISGTTQATQGFWPPKARALDLRGVWIVVCADPRILTSTENTMGLSNLPGFRYARATLSSLAFAPYINCEGHFPERIVCLRPQSRLAHLFLKRIEDAEAVARGGLVGGLIRSWRDLGGAED